MKLIDRIKNMFGTCECEHVYQTRIDESYTLEDEKDHIFQIEYCTKCGKIRSIEELN